MHVLYWVSENKTNFKTMTTYRYQGLYTIIVQFPVSLHNWGVIWQTLEGFLTCPKACTPIPCELCYFSEQAAGHLTSVENKTFLILWGKRLPAILSSCRYETEVFSTACSIRGWWELCQLKPRTHGTWADFQWLPAIYFPLFHLDNVRHVFMM